MRPDFAVPSKFWVKNTDMKSSRFVSADAAEDTSSANAKKNLERPSQNQNTMEDKHLILTGSFKEFLKHSMLFKYKELSLWVTAAVAWNAIILLAFVLFKILMIFVRQ